MARGAGRESHARLQQLLDRWWRRFPDSRVFDCDAGYCFIFCVIVTYPGQPNIPPLLTSELPQCRKTLPSTDPCSRFREVACADFPHLCDVAGDYADHSRCHTKSDQFLAAVARDACSGMLAAIASWQGETSSAAPRPTAGWCERFAKPPPGCPGSTEGRERPALPPPAIANDRSSLYDDAPCPCDDIAACPVTLGRAMAAISHGADIAAAQRWIDRCEAWVNAISDPTPAEETKLPVDRTGFLAYREALARYRRGP